MNEGVQRFVDAQAAVYERARAELRAGRKRTHWMWFVFPQSRGLGSSPMADRFGIASLDEARDYLDHPLLSARLETCTRYVIDASPRTLAEIFGSPDDLKFHSCMTLFWLASNERHETIGLALKTFWNGDLDERTVALVGSPVARKLV